MATHERTGRASVPRMVHAGLDRVDWARVGAYRTPVVTYADRARRLGRLAALYEREARWWDVLARHTYVAGEAPLVYGRAVIEAHYSAKRSGESYRDLEATAWARSLAVAADSGVAA